MDTASSTYGVCRCCLTKGNHRNIMKEYNFQGIREVYLEIIMDCFNLFLSTNTSLSSLICSSCIGKLRDARDFRSMVAKNEAELLHLVEKKETEFVNVSVEEPMQLEVQVKSEPVNSVKVEEISDDEEVVCDYESVTADELIDGDNSSSEEALLARFPLSSLKPLPTRRDLHKTCPEFARRLDLFKHLLITPNIISLMTQKDGLKKQKQAVYTSEKLAYITNAMTLLQNSNMTPFRSKSRSGFPCFYCRSIFEEFSKLKDHIPRHKPIEMLRVLKQCSPESLVVYAEVTNLKCTVCGCDLPSINELKHHLVNKHQKKMYLNVNDRVIPFMVSHGGCICSICGCNFETFGAVERHMNGHYRNYVCKECGTGFITKYRLKVHVKSMHADGAFPCDMCGKVFSTQQKHKNHVNAVHKLLKRFKCTKCPQRFTEYFRRQKHLEEIHGVTPLKYNCNVCERSFTRRYTLSRHLKRDHLEERDHQCEVCAYKCFTKNELKVHMIKHNGERIYECSVCKKSYARKKTLKEHMRIHNNDRRFVCAVCGQAFVQKCSLKGHLKTHHLEYSLQ